MKALLKLLEKMKPLHEKGGKLEKLYPLYEAGDTFLFTSPEVTKGAPHVRDQLDMKRYMITVLVAMLPCLFFGMYNAGHQYHWANGIQGQGFLAHMLAGASMVMPIVLTSYLVGGLWEVLFAVVRKHEISEGFLITGMLFPLTLPPTIPLWQVAVGISFGVLIGKEIFGGVGFNVLNPALTARAFLFFAYPGQISGDQVWTKVVEGGQTVAGFTGATPLAVAAATKPGAETVVEHLEKIGYTLKSMAIGLEGGSIGETSFLAVLIGVAILLVTGVGAWRIMAGGVVGLLVTASLFNLLPEGKLTPFVHLPAMYHLVMGSFGFGIVFMATDPVSAAATNLGKWIYGFLIGFLTVVIRVANPAYPEGTMLAILFMNVMAPLVDYFVLQGHIRKRARYLRKFRHA